MSSAQVVHVGVLLVDVVAVEPAAHEDVGELVAGEEVLGGELRVARVPDDDAQLVRLGLARRDVHRRRREADLLHEQVHPHLHAALLEAGHVLEEQRARLHVLGHQVHADVGHLVPTLERLERERLTARLRLPRLLDDLHRPVELGRAHHHAVVLDLVLGLQQRLPFLVERPELVAHVLQDLRRQPRVAPLVVPESAFGCIAQFDIRVKTTGTVLTVLVCQNNVNE